MAHGGKRDGAGRPPKEPPGLTGGVFDDPLAYLMAVAEGREVPCQLRIAAAKAALPYTTPKSRAPVASPTPRSLQSKTEGATAAVQLDEWRRKAAEIRKKHEQRHDRD